MTLPKILDSTAVLGRKADRSSTSTPTTKIKHLRAHYGLHFAPGWDGDSTLGELLRETKFESLTQYVKHHGHHPESQTE